MDDLCHVGKNKNKLSPISPLMDGLWLFFVSPTWTKILREVDGISTCRSCSHSGILTLFSEGHCVEVDILKIIIGACKPANISGLTAQKWMISTRTFDISKYIYIRIYIYTYIFIHIYIYIYHIWLYPDNIWYIHYTSMIYPLYPLCSSLDWPNVRLWWWPGYSDGDIMDQG